MSILGQSHKIQISHLPYTTLQPAVTLLYEHGLHNFKLVYVVDDDDLEIFEEVTILNNCTIAQISTSPMQCSHCAETSIHAKSARDIYDKKGICLCGHSANSLHVGCGH